MSSNDGSSDLWAARRHEATERLKQVELTEGSDPQVAMEQALEVLGRNLASRWRAEADQLLAEETQQRSRFTTDLRQVWGQALDYYDIFLQGAEQAGADFAHCVAPNAALPNVLLTLHAAACTTAHEIHWLLSGGYPFGAEARTRTMHELGVIARVLANFGAADEGLVRRYVEYHDVEDWKYWTYLAKNHQSIGAEPPDPEIIVELDARIADLKAEHGPRYTEPYGWAVDINPSCKFDRLEELAGYTDRRLFYKLSSAGPVHAGPSTLRQHLVQREGGRERLSNATMRGLARPAVVASVWLLEISTVVLTSMEASKDDQVGHLLGVLALKQLQSSVSDAFVRAERRYSG